MFQLTHGSHGSTKTGENNRFSCAKTSFGTLHSDSNELSGFLVGETVGLKCVCGVGW